MEKIDKQDIEIQTDDDTNNKERTETGSGQETSAEVLQWEEKYHRLAADFANYKKRTRQEWGQVELRAKAELIDSMLTIYNDFNRLINESEEINDGVLAVKKVWDAWLEENNVLMMQPKDDLFNPDEHEAVFQVPVDDPEMDGRVIQVIENGYFYKETVLRHARVSVGSFRNSEGAAVEGSDSDEAA